MDVVARELSPHIVNIVDKVVSDPEHAFSKDQITDIKKMIEHLRDFDGEMTEDSISPTIYNYWQYFFYRSLMHRYTTAGKNERMKTIMEEVDGKMETQKFWSTARRLGAVDNYTFMEFYQRVVIAVAQGTDTPAQNNICKGAYDDDHRGKDVCAHNIARAFFDVSIWLETEISTNPRDWIYRNIHVNEYPAVPWSLTKLKPFWHRKVPVGGNG